MSDIVKICKIHGELTKEKVRIRTPTNISCKACGRLATNKHRKLHREKLLIKEQEYRDKNRERLRKRDREWKAKDYIENKEKYIIRSKRFYNKNKEKRKNYRLKKFYGITLDDYKRMIVEQDNKCYLCKNPETAFHKNSKITKDLCVDHNHITGKARRLLCCNCNCLIGYCSESIDILQEAIKYLREFQDDKSRI